MRSTVLVVVILQLLASESFCVATSHACQSRIQSLLKDLPAINALIKVLQDQEEPLTYEQVNSTYFPTCNPDGSFTKRQCLFPRACWCSQKDGSLIEGTFQQGTDLDCGKATSLCAHSHTVAS